MGKVLITKGENLYRANFFRRKSHIDKKEDNKHKNKNINYSRSGHPKYP